MTLFFIIVPIIFAFGYRLRGMAHASLDDTDSRILFWALPYAFYSLALCYAMHEYPTHTFIVFFASAACAFVAATVPHASYQSTGSKNYLIMGLITTGMLSIMLMPFIVLNWHIIEFIPLGMLGAVASLLGYTFPFNLKLFGLQICVKGDSSCEELLIGLLAFGLPLGLIGVFLT